MEHLRAYGGLWHEKECKCRTVGCTAEKIGGRTRWEMEDSEVYMRETGGLQKCTFFCVHQKVNLVILRG